MPQAFYALMNIFRVQAMIFQAVREMNYSAKPEDQRNTTQTLNIKHTSFARLENQERYHQIPCLHSEHIREGGSSAACTLVSMITWRGELCVTWFGLIIMLFPGPAGRTTGGLWVGGLLLVEA